MRLVDSAGFFLHIENVSEEQTDTGLMAWFKYVGLTIFRPIRDFFIKHPAVLSGYIIYAYFFITTMDFFRDAKKAHGKPVSIFERFDALIWMWLLAVVLVKVIEYRNRLNEQERLRLEREKELEMKGMQLETAHQLIRTLQHQINNPLTVILLYVQRALRKGEAGPEVLDNLSQIKESAERIAATLREFAHAQGIETVDSPVGGLITPSKKDDSARAVDEASPS
jgi:signal transduction histidine kinase